jgi:hypothetical protein
MKNKLAEISNFRSENVEKLVAEETADIKNFAKKLGKSYAESRFPPASGIKLISVIGEVKARCEKLCISVCKELQSATHFPEVNSDRISVEAEKEKANEIIKDLKYKNQDTEAEQKKLNVNGIYRNVREVRIKTALFFAAEALFTSLSFQFFGENLLMSILIAIPFTMAVSEYAHLVAMQYKKYQHPIKRRLFLLASILFASFVFFGLSYFRSQALGKEGISIATLFFVMINLFIFLVSAFLHYKYSLTKEEKIKYHTYKKLKEEMDQRKAEIEMIVQHFSDMDAKLQEKAMLAFQLEHYAKNTIEEIKKDYEEAVEKLKSTNTLLRNDNVYPECYLEPTPKLEINYDFNLYKFNDKE